MTFLPQGYEKPASNSNYKKFAQGDNKFRILSDAITGWIDWEATTDGGRKPVRTKEKKPAINQAMPPKHFWSFIIWDYNEQNIKILEITQATIQDAIFNLHSDANWGDPKGYDFNVKKTGEKMETKYSVIPAPPKPLNEEIKEKYATTNIDLNALYKNEDPFNNNVPNSTQGGQKKDDFFNAPIIQEDEIDVSNINFGN